MNRKLIASILFTSAALSGCGLFGGNLFGGNNASYGNTDILNQTAQAASTVRTVVTDRVSGAVNSVNSRINAPMIGGNYDTGRNSIFMTDFVERGSGPGRPVSSYDCGKPVFAYLTVYDDNNIKPPKMMEAVWYMNGKRIQSKPYEPNYTNNPHHVWFWINSSELGAGNGKVDVLGDGQLYQSSNFTVLKNGNCSAGPERITLGADGMFAYNKSGWDDLQADGRQKLDQLAARLKTDYKQISAISVTGHTDHFGSAALNSALSQARASTVREYLIRRGGVDASVIRAQGVGPSQPVKTCPGQTRTPETIACLLPNRRVEVEVTGTR